MTIAYTLLIELAAVAASFALLWLSFRMRDRRRIFRETQPAGDSRRGHPPVSDLPFSQSKLASAGRSGLLASVPETRCRPISLRAMSKPVGEQGQPFIGQV
jgi:hypothetical protein